MEIKNASPICTLDVTLQGGEFILSIFRKSESVTIKHISPKAAYKLVSRLNMEAEYGKGVKRSLPHMGETSYGPYMEYGFRRA